MYVCEVYVAICRPHALHALRMIRLLLLSSSVHDNNRFSIKFAVNFFNVQQSSMNKSMKVKLGINIQQINRDKLSGGATCSRLQLPLKAATIHKSQGLTLGKAVVDIGSKEFCVGLTFVACSCVRCLDDLMFSPGFDFDRISI